MKTSHKFLLAASICGFSFNLEAAPDLVPNGDFETAGGANWGEAGGPQTVFSYPTSGGNPGGYGVMTNSGGGFGVFIAGDDSQIPLGDLGLTAGEAYVFSQDMIILSGSDLGKLKIEFYQGGVQFQPNTGDMVRTPVDGGANWAKYEYTVPIPSGTEAIKIVPVAGLESSVGFDNIGFDDTPVEVPPAPPIPNGDFEIPDGASWHFASGGDGSHSVDFPTTGGNPITGGFAQISSTGAGSAELVSNSNAPLALSTIGLTPGETYTVTMDMKVISGSNIGSFKAEYSPTGSGVMTPTLVGDGSTWENYAFVITVPELATVIFLHLISGEDSVVAFDNVDIIIPVEPAFYANINKGTIVNWVLEAPGLIHQPQGSFDQAEWVNIGAGVVDDSITSAFDPVGYPFYRVEVLERVLDNIVLNGDLEENFNDETCADSWVCFSPPAMPPATNQPPTWTDEDAQSGNGSVRIAVQNDTTDTPNTAELQQNIEAEGGFIFVNETYEFSFWAKQISSGVSYVQRYRVNWLDSDGAIVGGPDFVDFSGGDGVWEKISVGGLTAPDNAVTAFVQIFGSTGSVPSVEARGEVLVDNISLTTSRIEPYEDIEATTSEGVGISWLTEEGKTYQVESATDLKEFTDFGMPRPGTGGLDSVADSLTEERKQYRVIEMP